MFVLLFQLAHRNTPPATLDDKDINCVLLVTIINSKRSKSPRIMDLVRALTLQTLKYNFYFKALHVPGHYNDIADSISG